MGECGRIGVVAGTDDDSGMNPLGFAMEVDEVEAVQSENGPVLLRRVTWRKKCRVPSEKCEVGEEVTAKAQRSPRDAKKG